MQWAAQSSGGDVTLYPKIYGNGGIAVKANFALNDVTAGAPGTLISANKDGSFTVPAGAAATVKSFVLAVQPAFFSATSADVHMPAEQSGNPLQNSDPPNTDFLATVANNGTAGSIYPCPFFISFA